MAVLYIEKDKVGCEEAINKEDEDDALYALFLYVLLNITYCQRQ